MGIQDGIILLGPQVLGYTERQILVLWDIAPDLRDSRKCFTPNPYLGLYNTRYISQVYLQSLSNTRWSTLEHVGPPYVERKVYIYYSQCLYSNRGVYYYPDTSYRFVYTEGLFTATPLLLKYPKYYNWSYLPQVLTPEFRVWSFYPLDKCSITLKIVTDKGKFILVSAGNAPDKVQVTQETDKIYRIVFHLDVVFDHGEKIDCYLSLYDVKGNHLKDGLW